MKKYKLFISGGLLAAFTIVAIGATFISGSSTLKSNEADPARTFTYFVHVVDGTGVGGHYDAYDQNPGVLYLTKDPFTYKQAVKSGNTYTQGEEVTNNVALRFESAVATQEQNGFITNLNSGVDILEMDYAPETANTMYANGKLMDLTYWVENYMPNYLAYVDSIGFGDLAATRDSDGNKQYLQLYSYQNNTYEYYYGFQYRRDWVLKYGKTFDTQTGAIGTQTFQEAHPDWGWNEVDGSRVWSDDIIFPSYYGLQYTSDGAACGTGTLTFNQDLYDYMQGTYKSYSEQRAAQLEGELSHLERDYDTYRGQWPATISDWEWMLDIFQVAIKDLYNDERGYCMSLYQSGYIATGNLLSSFGGNGAEWQTNKDKSEVIFGADQSAFKTYVSTMNQWWNNGWIDKQFQTHSDLMWRTDENNVRQGYVGLYFGMDDQLFEGMDIGAGQTKDIYTLGMPYPINDKYGEAENQYVMPYTFYSMSHEVNSIMISKACEDSGKDLAALFTMLDKAYSPEMAAIKGWGMTQEMLEESQPGVAKLYEKLGFPNGVVEYDSEKQAYYRHTDAPDIPVDDQYIVGAKRLFGLEGFVANYNQTRKDDYKQYLWNFYDDTGYLTKSFYTQLNDAQYSLYNDKVGQLRNTLATDIPKFIKGGANGYSMSEWDDWYSNLKSTLGLDNITRMLNSKYQTLQ